MQISCPNCGEQLPISDQLLGKKIRCGGCRVVVDIPKELGEDENVVGESATVAAIQSSDMPDQAITPVQSAPTKSPAAQHAAPVSLQPDDNTPTMLVDCACGNRSRVPTSSAGSDVRCPSCQRLMRIPNPPAERNPTFVSGGAFPATPLPLSRSDTTAATSIAQAPIDHPYPVQPKQQPTNNKNTPIIITAVSCLIVLVLLVGVAIVLESSPNNPTSTAVEPVQEESDSTDRVNFQEGYSMLLPAGCKQESREETRGYIVYRFRSEEGFSLTLAMIPDESIDRFSIPPKKIRQAYVKGIPDLDLNIDAEIQPKHISVNGLRAVVFRFYEEEFYTGVRFTYFMVVLDEGRKLVLKFSGKHGDADNITWPEHWYESLVTLRNERYAKKPNAIDGRSSGS